MICLKSYTAVKGLREDLGPCSWVWEPQLHVVREGPARALCRDSSRCAGTEGDGLSPESRKLGGLGRGPRTGVQGPLRALRIGFPTRPHKIHFGAAQWSRG